MPKLTHERLLQLLSYDADTGAFHWRVSSSNRIHVGDRAGAVGANGRRFIMVEGEKFQAHRLAWFYVHKEWPVGDVRQENGNYDDASLKNLSAVSRIGSAARRGPTKDNTSGFRGVSPRGAGRWQASITWNYRQVNLGGNFETPEEASEIYEFVCARMALATTEEERGEIIAAARLLKRKRAAWKHLNRQSEPHGWVSFDEFSASLTEVPEFRYAMVPVDLAKPIGPDNFRWALPHDSEHSTRDGIVAYHRVNRIANRNHYRGKDFRKKYGIGFAEYEKLLEQQNGVCACCGRGETKIQNGAVRLLSVDHDHTTGDVRGLLCGNCNMAIGYAGDDIEILRKAIAYLERHAASAAHKFAGGEFACTG